MRNLKINEKQKLWNKLIVYRMKRIFQKISFLIEQSYKKNYNKNKHIYI